MATYYTLGLEPFKLAQVYGVHGNKEVALKQAEQLDQEKHPHCCQVYKVLTETEVKKGKWELFS